MKKLKTWQIVLLVIFYPVGICVWIYRAVKRSQLKKAREAEQAALSARREAERAEREKFEAVRAQISRHRSERREWLDANCDYVSFKLVGVTFNNDDGVGRNRQDILREIEEDGELDNFSYDTYDYEGNTAVGVYYNGEQIGNIAQTDLKSSFLVPYVSLQISRSFPASLVAVYGSVSISINNICTEFSTAAQKEKAGEAIEPRPLFLHDYTSERLPRAPAVSSAR